MNENYCKTLQEEIQYIRTELNDLEKSLVKINAQNFTQSDALKLSDRISSLEGDVNLLKGTLQNINTSISKLDDKMERSNGNIEEIKESVVKNTFQRNRNFSFTTLFYDAVIIMIVSAVFKVILRG